jgi:hypothetical protein
VRRSRLHGVCVDDGCMYVCAVKDLRRRRYDVEDDGGQMGVRELGTGFSSLGVLHRLVSGFVFF